MPFLNLETWLLSVSGLELIVPIQDQKQIFWTVEGARSKAVNPEQSSFSSLYLQMVFDRDFCFYLWLQKVLCDRWMDCFMFQMIVGPNFC
jgi:hypothetical protein